MYTVFGSRGFIGSEIVKFLNKKNIKFFIPIKKKVKFKKNLGDIIYCVGSDDWKKFPAKGFQSNLGHLTSVLFNCKFKSFLFLSSSRVYINNQQKNTKENSKLKVNPADLNDYYNLLKLTSESVCLSLKHKNIKIIRLSNVLGQNFNSPLVFPSMIRDSIKRNKINLTINKNSTKDYIHINDVIDIVFKIIKKGKKKNI